MNIPPNWNSGEKTEVRNYFAINIDKGYRTGIGLQFSGLKHDVIFKFDYTHGLNEISLSENQYRVVYFRLNAIFGF
jgi:hypothetical protein